MRLGLLRDAFCVRLVRLCFLYVLSHEFIDKVAVPSEVWRELGVESSDKHVVLLRSHHHRLPFVSFTECGQHLLARRACQRPSVRERAQRSKKHAALQISTPEPLSAEDWHSLV